MYYIHKRKKTRKLKKNNITIRSYTKLKLGIVRKTFHLIYFTFVVKFMKVCFLKALFAILFSGNLCQKYGGFNRVDLEEDALFHLVFSTQTEREKRKKKTKGVKIYREMYI